MKSFTVESHPQISHPQIGSPSAPSAPIITQQMPWENIQDLTMINNQRLASITNIFNKITEERKRSLKRFNSKKTLFRISESFKHFCMAAGIPVVGASMLFPILLPFTMPVAVTGGIVGVISDLCNVKYNRDMQKYTKIMSSCDTLLKNLQIITKDVTKDGIITQVEYDIIMGCFEQFNNSLVVTKQS